MKRELSMLQKKPLPGCAWGTEDRSRVSSDPGCLLGARHAGRPECSETSSWSLALSPVAGCSQPDWPWLLANSWA